MTTDVDDALAGDRELDGAGLPRPDLDDEHAEPEGFGREAAWPTPARARTAQIGCDPTMPAPVVTPEDQLTWQAEGGAAAEKCGR
ncbi:hypothetical protein A3C17_04600 [Candidatus Uhrbacteria bacterium RIFCSPHIGHO2_02_FULL_53_13]|uniref:Uncharacterized protein n=1 Tax=Candidatus Uhrbacteria bacterium RIFCSPHIGHO2_02_FULL_53_13 TaxID=1802389 RepID=A0A1F7U1A5_9BACT|nr:MAG: hypothetical protein A3C17_04600 [Candidatus Uhrbacteria bacterium RIFCSPHIGHO2_02_FULL_53_13]